MPSNQTSNLLIGLVFITLSVIIVILGFGLIDEFGLLNWLLAIWGMIGVICSLDIACKIVLSNYKSIFTFVNILGTKDKVVFWGAILMGSLPLAVYLRFRELFEVSSFSFIVALLPVLSILFAYFPLRLFGSSKLKERILEKRS